MTRIEKFLTNRGLLEAFKTNYINSPPPFNLSYEQFLIHYGSHEDVINWSFSWSESPEGNSVWRKIDKEWLESFNTKTL